MTMRRNPSIQLSNHGMIYGVNKNGEFDMGQSTRIKGIPLEMPLRNATEVALEATPTQLLLWIRESQTAIFEGAAPIDRFSITAGTYEKSFFRTRFTDDNTILSTYTDIDEIVRNELYHTPELCDLIDYIPDEELRQFGISCLKKIVK